jgi:hypothetical protein
MTNDSSPTAVRSVTLFFDPMCPWTWRTSRWIVDTTGRRGVPMRYRAFDLMNGKPLDEVSPDWLPSATASRRILRAVEAAHRDGMDDVVHRWYTAYGTARWSGTAPSAQLVESTLAAAGGEALRDALDDESLDKDVAQARAEAHELDGDDIGSPVLLWDTAAGTRGFFGPVVAPTPTGAEADSLWDIVTAAVATPHFYELKTRRTQSAY